MPLLCDDRKSKCTQMYSFHTTDTTSIYIMRLITCCSSLAPFALAMLRASRRSTITVVFIPTMPSSGWAPTWIVLLAALQVMARILHHVVHKCRRVAHRNSIGLLFDHLVQDAISLAVAFIAQLCQSKEVFDSILIHCPLLQLCQPCTNIGFDSRP